jgi:hypothetical protein
MTKVKFYALCSRGIEVTKRHLRTIPKQDLHIVINTLDSEYEKKAVEFCKSNSIEYTVTKSDGTAATGKNSVLDIIANSEYSHGVMIDGDDFITDFGYKVYKKAVKLNPKIDVIAIENQYGLDPHPALVAQFDPKKFKGFINTNPENIPPVGIRPFARAGLYFSDSIKDQSEILWKWMQFVRKYIHINETHLRVVLLSKEVASQVRFNSDFIVAEDTIFYLDCKQLFASNKIVMRHIDDTVPTYVYDRRVNGVCNAETYKDDLAFDKKEWTLKMVSEYDKREKENNVSTKKVPILSIGNSFSNDIMFNKDYYPDALSLPNLYFNANQLLTLEE